MQLERRTWGTEAVLYVYNERLTEISKILKFSSGFFSHNFIMHVKAGGRQSTQMSDMNMWRMQRRREGL